jgi:hypothetical protein
MFPPHIWRKSPGRESSSPPGKRFESQWKKNEIEKKRDEPDMPRERWTTEFVSRLYLNRICRMDALDVFTYIKEKVPDINAGGCGIAALSVLRTIGYDPSRMSIVYLYDEDEEGEASCNMRLLNRNNLKGGCVPSHVCLLVDGDFLDADGDEPLLKYHLTHSGGTIRELIELINTGNHWNSDFDRSRALPIIEKFLGIDLSDIRC